MATTTNYGWTTPDDTALVKDGASAIRTLGSSVDTTLKNLNPETTLGDISYRSSTANTNTRLALGTAGQVLTVNSGATAPEWTTLATGGMTLISTTAMSGASISLSSIPATYVHLQLVIRNFLPATDNTTLKMRVNGDSTANRHFDVTNNVTNNQTFANTSWDVYNYADNSVSQNLIVITLYDYKNTVTVKIAESLNIWNNATTTTNFGLYKAYYAYNQTGAISSLDLFPASGNFTSGSVLLYGVK